MLKNKLYQLKGTRRRTATSQLLLCFLTMKIFKFTFFPSVKLLNTIEHTTD